MDNFTPRTIHTTRIDGSTKLRDIIVPTHETRRRHAEMLHTLYERHVPMPYATGGLPGCRLLDNITPHRQSNHFYMLDLADAFSHVDITDLKTIATSVAELRDTPLAPFIDEWVTHPSTSGLPQGAPASPYLFNLSCLLMDNALGGFCEQNDLIYTRYLDDLTFSSKSNLTNSTRRELRKIINDRPGSVINHAKSKLHHIDRGPVTITGMSLYPDRRIAPSPALLRTMHAVFDGVLGILASGSPVTLSDIGRVHGYHGVLEQTSTSETPEIRSLHRSYGKILAQLSTQDIQLSLF